MGIGLICEGRAQRLSGKEPSKSAEVARRQRNVARHEPGAEPAHARGVWPDQREVAM